MANLDSRSKRASSIGMMLGFVLAPPLPDGALSQGDRQHVAFSYSGISATLVVESTFDRLDIVERRTIALDERRDLDVVERRTLELVER